MAKDIAANWGERMIELKVHFWTDNIAGGAGKIVPKHAWASGVVRLQKNKRHVIPPQKSIIFNSLLQLPVAIEKAIIRSGVTIHLSRGMKKYFKR